MQKLKFLHVIVHILKFCEQQRKYFFVFLCFFLFLFVFVLICFVNIDIFVDICVVIVGSRSMVLQRNLR